VKTKYLRESQKEVGHHHVFKTVAATRRRFYSAAHCKTKQARDALTRTAPKRLSGKALDNQPGTAANRSGRRGLAGTEEELRKGRRSAALRRSPRESRALGLPALLACLPTSPPPWREREDSCSTIPGIRRGFSIRLAV
jgi:hypothetical protein